MIPDKLKRHLRKYQTVYAFGIGVVFAGVTCFIFRTKMAGTMSVRPLFLFSDNNRIITLIQRETTQGPPSWVVRCKESGEIFTSQKTAAILYNISEPNMSRHLSGRKPDVDGWHFERIAMAA